MSGHARQRTARLYNRSFQLENLKQSLLASMQFATDLRAKVLERRHVCWKMYNKIITPRNTVSSTRENGKYRKLLEASEVIDRYFVRPRQGQSSHVRNLFERLHDGWKSMQPGVKRGLSSIGIAAQRRERDVGVTWFARVSLSCNIVARRR